MFCFLSYRLADIQPVSRQQSDLDLAIVHPSKGLHNELTVKRTKLVDCGGLSQYMSEGIQGDRTAVHRHPERPHSSKQSNFSLPYKQFLLSSNRKGH